MLHLRRALPLYLVGYNAIDSSASDNTDVGMARSYSASNSPNKPAIWFRLLFESGAIGPGKIALMRAIAATGSVSAAARTLQMSHARSVKLVADINALASMPLIETRTGGDDGGGAALTELGHKVVSAHDDIAVTAQDAIANKLAALAELLSRADR